MDREQMSLATAFQIGTVGGEMYPNGRRDKVLGSKKARREINSAEREGLQPVIAGNSSTPTSAGSATVKLNGQIGRTIRFIEATTMVEVVAPSLTDDA